MADVTNRGTDAGRTSCVSAMRRRSVIIRKGDQFRSMSSDFLIQEDNAKHFLIIDPGSLWCRCWHLVMAAVVIYIVWLVSFELGFSWFIKPARVQLVSTFVDIACVLDIVLSFRTGYIHFGHLVMDWRRIGKHYLSFWFWVDLTASVPWEVFFTVSKSDRKAVKFVKWLKLPRLLRLGRLRKVMRANARYLNVAMLFTSILLVIHYGACAWVYILDPCSRLLEEEPFKNWSRDTDVDDVLVTRHPELGWECTQANIMPIYYQALHVSTAMLFGVDKVSFGGYIAGGGQHESLNEEVASIAEMLQDTPATLLADPAAAQARALKLWLLRQRFPWSFPRDGPWGDLSAFSRANSSSWAGVVNSGLTAALSQTSINTFGMKFASQLNVFGFVMLLVGIVMQGYLFAHLVRIVMQRGAAESQFRAAHDEVKREMEQFGDLIPESVQENIEKMFQFRWVNQAYGPLQLLNPAFTSSSLRSELALHLYGGLLTEVEVLRYAPIFIIKPLCLTLQPEYHSANEMLFRRGQVPCGFHCVAMGKVVLTKEETYSEASSQKHRTRTVTKGGNFGSSRTMACMLALARPELTQLAEPTVGSHRDMPLHKTSAFAATACHLLFCSIDALREVFEMYPAYFLDVHNTKACGGDGNPGRVTVRSAQSLGDDEEDEAVASQVSFLSEHSDDGLAVSEGQVDTRLAEYNFAGQRGAQEQVRDLDAHPRISLELLDEAAGPQAFANLKDQGVVPSDRPEQPNGRHTEIMPRKGSGEQPLVATPRGGGGDELRPNSFIGGGDAAAAHGVNGGNLVGAAASAAGMNVVPCRPSCDDGGGGGGRNVHAARRARGAAAAASAAGVNVRPCRLPVNGVSGGVTSGGAASASSATTTASAADVNALIARPSEDEVDYPPRPPLVLEGVMERVDELESTVQAQADKLEEISNALKAILSHLEASSSGGGRRPYVSNVGRSRSSSTTRTQV